jgi:hypothetical protein
LPTKHFNIIPRFSVFQGPLALRIPFQNRCIFFFHPSVKLNESVKLSFTIFFIGTFGSNKTLHKNWRVDISIRKCLKSKDISSILWWVYFSCRQQVSNVHGEWSLWNWTHVNRKQLLPLSHTVGDDTLVWLCGSVVGGRGITPAGPLLLKGVIVFSEIRIKNGRCAFKRHLTWPSTPYLVTKRNRSLF